MPPATCVDTRNIWSTTAPAFARDCRLAGALQNRSSIRRCVCAWQKNVICAGPMRGHMRSRWCALLISTASCRRNRSAIRAARVKPRCCVDAIGSWRWQHSPGGRPHGEKHNSSSPTVLRTLVPLEGNQWLLCAAMPSGVLWCSNLRKPVKRLAHPPRDARECYQGVAIFVYRNQIIPPMCRTVRTEESLHDINFTCYEPRIPRDSKRDRSDWRLNMPKGQQRGNREVKKPKQPKKKVTPPGTFIPLPPSKSR